MLTIESTTVEKLPVIIETPSDPTGTAPEFSIGTGTDPGTWVAGAWSSTWDSTTRIATSLTPLTGVAGMVLTQGLQPRLWARWHIGTEAPVRVVSVVQVI